MEHQSPLNSNPLPPPPPTFKPDFGGNSIPAAPTPVALKSPPAPAPAPIPAASTSEHIQIRLQDPSGGVVFFKLKKTAALGKVFAAYAVRQGQPVGSYRFLYDGNRVDETKTPATLNMSEDDVIDVMVAQTGGGDPNRSSSNDDGNHKESNTPKVTVNAVAVRIPYHNIMGILLPCAPSFAWMSALALVQCFSQVTIVEEEGVGIVMRYDAFTGAFSCGNMAVIVQQPIPDHMHYNLCSQLRVMIQEAMRQEVAKRGRCIRDLHQLSGLMAQTTLS